MNDEALSTYIASMGQIAEMKQKTNDEALNAYIASMGQIAELLESLTEWVDDHGGISLDDVTWADVGTVNAVIDRLTDITEFIG